MDGGNSASINPSLELLPVETPAEVFELPCFEFLDDNDSVHTVPSLPPYHGHYHMPPLPYLQHYHMPYHGPSLPYSEWMTVVRIEHSKKVDDEVERIKCEKDKLSKKPDTDPQVTEAAEFIETMTEEILDQKLRLTQNRCEVAGKGKVKKTRNGQYLNNGISKMEPRPWDHNETDSASPKPPLFDTVQLDVPGEETSVHKTDVAQRKVITSSGDVSEMKRQLYVTEKWHNVRLQEAVETPKHDTEVAQCKVTRSCGSMREVFSDVKMYLKQVTQLVQQKIQSLPQYVRDKLETLINSFQRLIAGMWKLLLLELLCYELARQLTSFPNDHANISKKKGRLKYGFEMAALLVLWLSHDVESNPGPHFSVRWCLERMTRELSAVLKKELQVKGTLWSESVKEAACAAGYSSKCQWANPSGNSKDTKDALIERATELGRVLTEMGCLPQEFVPFVSDLGNYKVQEQLVVHYKVEHCKAAVDNLRDVSRFSDAHKEDILHLIKTLQKMVPETSSSTHKQGLNNSCSPLADFCRPADTSASQTAAIKMQSKKQQRGPMKKRNRSRNQVKELQDSDMCTSTESNTSGQSICKPVLLYDTDVSEGFGGPFKWLDNEEEEVESGSLSTGGDTSPRADLSQAVDLQTNVHSSDPVPVHEENQPLQNEPYTDGDNSRVTVGNNSEDRVLTLSTDMPLSLSNTQTWIAEMDQIHDSEQSQTTGDTVENFHPKSTEQDIMQLLDLLPNQDSCNNTGVTVKESTTGSVMETSLPQTSATKQSTPECDTEVDVRRDCDLYPLGNHSTTETENVAFEELETAVTSHIPPTSTDQEREITVDDHETANTTGNRVTQGRDRCVSAVCHDHDRHDDTLFGTYSDGDRSNTRDTDVGGHQAMNNSETTPDNVTEHDNNGDSNGKLTPARQERSPEENHSTKQDSHKWGCREDNKASSNETITKKPKVTSMTPSCTREPTGVEDSQFEAFKASVLKDMDVRWKAFKAAQETHARNGHDESNNDCDQAESHAQNRKRRLSQTEYPVKRRK